MREVHVIVNVPEGKVPEGYDDIHVTHEPAENFEGNDPNATKLVSNEADTTVIIHWAGGIPKDNEVVTHATDAVLRSLGL